MAALDEPKSLFDLKGWLIYFNLLVDMVVGFSRSGKVCSSLLSRTNESLLEKAVLALEDRYFYSHKGVDFRCFYRVLKQVLKRKKVGGVSTIEQQFVRTVLNRKERTLGRKINEVVVARLLWFHLSKRKILISYLGCAYYGYRLNGSDAASQTIFGLASDQLSLEQSVFIASLLVYPLPKTIKADLTGSENNIQRILEHARNKAPFWACNVERRMNYGINLLSNVK